MRRKHLGPVLAALGVVLVVVSVLADALGIGGQDYVFGWLQIAGVVAGSAIVTWWVVRGRGHRRREIVA